MIITTPDKFDGICRQIIEDFDRRILSLYDEEAIKNQYILTRDRLGQEKKFPVMSISLAVVTSESGKYENYLQIAEVAAEVKKFVKSMPGSNYMKDRRE